MTTQEVWMHLIAAEVLYTPFQTPEKDKGPVLTLLELLECVYYNATPRHHNAILHFSSQ
jgi:hypothetical protein